MDKKIKDKYNVKEIKEELRWMFRYVNDYRGKLALILVINAVGGILSVVTATLSKPLIDCVTGTEPIETLRWVIPVMLGSFIFNLLMGAVGSRLGLDISLKLSYQMKQDIFEKIMVSDWQKLNKYHSGDLLNRMTSDASAVIGVIVDVLPSAVSILVRFIFAVIVMLCYDATMGVIALILCPISAIMIRVLGRKLREFNRRSQEALSENQSFIQESIQNSMIIKSFGLSGVFSNKLKVIQKKHYELSMEKNNFSIMLKIGFSVLYQLASYATLGYGAYRLYTKSISMGEFTSFMSLISQIQSPLVALLQVLPVAITATSSAGRIIEILQLPTEKSYEPNGLKQSDSISLELQNVSFAYDDGKNVLENVSLEASAGKITALIGESGGGKTTIIRLFLGLINAQSGEVLLNGNTKASPDTRRLFSYVPQGNTLFSGTIEENLKLADPDATEQEMLDALECACALDFVRELPDGIKTVIGEKSMGLSEGQSQRIAIARALLRKAPIILLDEVTSALDIETERKVLENINSSLSGKTCIVITHRTTVFEICDKIYRIKEHKASLADSYASEV